MAAMSAAALGEMGKGDVREAFDDPVDTALALVPDCEFSQAARWAAEAKLRALVTGRDLLRGRRPG
ncbi:MAG: hypothetical protein V2B17_02410 [Chloroflexota bacterium]